LIGKCIDEFILVSSVLHCYAIFVLASYNRLHLISLIIIVKERWSAVIKKREIIKNDALNISKKNRPLTVVLADAVACNRAEPLYSSARHPKPM
jgi:hypothetical protein